MKIEDLRKASVVMAKSDVRFYLMGIMVDGANIVATDGFRAVHCVTGGDQHDEIIIPRDTVLAFLKETKGQEDFEIKDNHLVSGGISMGFEPIDGKFPSYERAFLAHNYDEGKVNCIAFNPKYVADIAKIYKSKFVRFSFTSESGICKISVDDQSAYYLMPCRD